MIDVNVEGGRKVVELVATEVKLDEATGDCLPQDKVTFVHRLKAHGHRVAVVGDGVNDACHS